MAEKKYEINDILKYFNISASTEKYGNGHINDTFLTGANNYILQRINTSIFTDPDALMENIENVTTFLKKKIIASGGDPERETLTIIKTTDGKNLVKLDDENVFRAYKFINNTLTIEQSSSSMDMYNAGVGFGHFQKMLDDFPVGDLHETIKDFHNTPKRVEALKTAIKEDKAGRAEYVKEVIDFALSKADFADTVVKEMDKGNIPVRVTHNDTKINNILFDASTKKALCVIDLDTVMPGSALYDFGDALRIGASTAAEDEIDLDVVYFSTEYFRSFAKGFLEEVGDKLTAKEKELLPFSAKLLTYECGIRFLTDYLNGDTYFKIHRPNHNLERARNQFKLVKDIENKERELNSIIAKLAK